MNVTENDKRQNKHARDITITGLRKAHFFDKTLVQDAQSFKCHSYEKKCRSSFDLNKKNHQDALSVMNI